MYIFPPNAWSLINGECKYKTFMFVLCQISTSVRAIRVNMMAFCMDHVNEYTCTCQPGFQGTHCEIGRTHRK